MHKFLSFNYNRILILQMKLLNVTFGNKNKVNTNKYLTLNF